MAFRRIVLAVCVAAAAVGLAGPSSLGQTMYWADPMVANILRANLQGENVAEFLSGERPTIIALDIPGGKIYWLGAIESGGRRGPAWACVEDPGRTCSPAGVFVGGPHDGACCNSTGDRVAWSLIIRRSNLDGSGVEDLLHAAGPIALDLLNRKIYWGDFLEDSIRRANLDLPPGQTMDTRTDIEDLVTTGLMNPLGLALDLGGGKMYWTDSQTNKIQRANIDGSDVEDLMTAGGSNLRAIALDVPAGKMYWASWNGKKVLRANLDGSGIEGLITTGQVGPTGLALDLGAGRMYWTDSDFNGETGSGAIRSAALDGSDVETLIPDGPIGPYWIALNLDAGTDTDGDGVPDADDVCEGQDDLLDANGDGVPNCLEVDTIPTASGWGMVALALLLLAGARLRNHPRPTALRRSAAK